MLYSSYFGRIVCGLVSISWLLVCLPLSWGLLWWGRYHLRNKRTLDFARNLPTILPTLPILGHVHHIMPCFTGLVSISWLLVCVPLSWGLLWWGWYHLRYKRTLDFARNLPTILPTLPVFGHLHHIMPFFAEPGEFLTSVVFEKMNKMAAAIRQENYCLWIGPFPIIFITSPEDIGIIMKSSKTLNKGPEYVLIDFYVDETSLLTAKKDIWKPTRRSLEPIFHPRNLDLLAPTNNAKARELVAALHHHAGTGSANILPVILPNVLLTIQDLIFGKCIQRQRLETKPEEVPDYVKLITSSFRVWGERFTKYFILFDLSSLFHIIYRKDLEMFQTNKVSFTKSAIEGYLSQPHTNVENEENFSKTSGSDVPLNIVDIYLSPLRKYESYLTERSLHQNLVTMATAAVDTSATTIASMCLMLAMHPEVQEKVYEEINLVMGDFDRDVTPEDVKKMTYMEMVLKETLRMFPNFPLISRTATEDLRLSSSIVPAGTHLHIFIYGLHKNPNYFPDPERFDPERFTKANSEGRHKCAHVPFSAGPRNCIGKEYAMMSLRITMAHVVKRLKLKTDMKMEDIKLAHTMELFIKGGYPVSVERRK